MKDFLLKALNLKELDRAGWKRAGLESPETVASHSWGLSLLCITLAPKELNLEKILALATVHDLPEVMVGDITPHDGITKEEKQKLEYQAAKSWLPEHLFELWKEYEENQTPEAQFVHQMDKLDMYLQALKYQSQIDSSEFIQSAKAYLESHWLKSIES